MKNPLQHVLTKCKYLLYLESKLEPEERAAHQWQMLCKRSGVQYILGKGGANTCFITIGGGERKLFYPEEFIKYITTLAKQKYGAYGILNKASGKVSGPWVTLEETKRKKPKRTELGIVGIDDSGNHQELYYSSKALNGIYWAKSGQAA